MWTTDDFSFLELEFKVFFKVLFSSLAHIGIVHERKNPAGKINNAFSSLNKHK